MAIKAEIHWDKRYDIEKAIFLHCSTIVDTNGFSGTFSMNLDNGKKLKSYLSGVRQRGFGIINNTYWKRTNQQSGEYIYELNEKSLNKTEFEEIKEFHQLNYLVTRNESVPHEEYSKFYGSSQMIWDLDLCNYPTGTYPEQFIQTLYDM